ncbi:MAG: hypothetical protein ACFB12_22355 [Leptolyngbyaceae cyanobacterium]
MTWLVYRSLSALSRLIRTRDKPRFVAGAQWWAELLGEGMATAAIARCGYFAHWVGGALAAIAESPAGRATPYGM